MFQARVAAVAGDAVALAGGEAARGMCQRHAAIGEHFGLQRACGVREHRDQLVAVHLQRHAPAEGAQLRRPGHRVRVEHVELRPGDKGLLARQQADGRHVVGFDQKFPVVHHLLHQGQIGGGFGQHQRAQHHLLALVAQPVANVDPVLEPHFLAARAHGFAEVDDVHRRPRHGLVKREDVFAGPVVKQGTEGELHMRSFVDVWWRAVRCAL
ncbi:hypothetical protein SDC9_66845 [bioreactor metagenome]|uniref:Uncharacterized protein n=1 Tax=bioreactor metagenome TaxID=1076179 RepID=A0A644XW49_9ZZZZ